MATNGVVVAIMTGDDRLIFGHIDYFVVDKDLPVEVVKQVKKAKQTKTTKKTINIMEFA